MRSPRPVVAPWRLDHPSDRPLAEPESIPVELPGEELEVAPSNQLAQGRVPRRRRPGPRHRSPARWRRATRAGSAAPPRGFGQGPAPAPSSDPCTARCRSRSRRSVHRRDALGRDHVHLEAGARKSSRSPDRSLPYCRASTTRRQAPSSHRPPTTIVRLPEPAPRAERTVPIDGRCAQRGLAVRLHPLAPGRLDRGRGPRLARRPLAVLLGVRPSGGSAATTWGDVHRGSPGIRPRLTPSEAIRLTRGHDLLPADGGWSACWRLMLRSRHAGPHGSPRPASWSGSTSRTGAPGIGSSSRRGMPWSIQAGGRRGRRPATGSLPDPGGDQRRSHRSPGRARHRLVPGAGALRPAGPSRPRHRSWPSTGAIAVAELDGPEGGASLPSTDWTSTATTPSTRPAPICCAGPARAPKRGWRTTVPSSWPTMQPRSPS